MTTALVAKKAGELIFAGPVGSLDSYIDRVSQIPVLSKEDEVALAVRFSSEADWTPPGNWCFRTCDSLCTLPADIWAMACRWAIWCKKAMWVS